MKHSTIFIRIPCEKSVNLTQTLSSSRQDGPRHDGPAETPAAQPHAARRQGQPAPETLPRTEPHIGRSALDTVLRPPEIGRGIGVSQVGLSCGVKTHLAGDSSGGLTPSTEVLQPRVIFWVQGLMCGGEFPDIV